MSSLLHSEKHEQFFKDKTGLVMWVPKPQLLIVTEATNPPDIPPKRYISTTLPVSEANLAIDRLMQSGCILAALLSTPS